MAYKKFALPLLLIVAMPASPADVEAKVVAWRRDFHQNPELSNREVRTAGIVADHLRGLGLEVQTGIAQTGVVALLRTGKPGPTIALRADMDALPVTERTDVPFRSVARSNYRGEDVGIMHACGHDAHTAVLMGVAETLAGMKSKLRGNVLFVFQPAEEGGPARGDGGPGVMVGWGGAGPPFRWPAPGGAFKPSASPALTNCAHDSSMVC